MTKTPFAFSWISMLRILIPHSSKTGKINILTTYGMKLFLKTKICEIGVWNFFSKNSVKFHGKIYKLFHFGAVCFHHSILCIFLRCRYDDIIPLAKNCTEIYVWHTMTFSLPYRQLHLENLNAINDADTNLPKLLENTT